VSIWGRIESTENAGTKKWGTKIEQEAAAVAETARIVYSFAYSNLLQSDDTRRRRSGITSAGRRLYARI